ncbi:hypothetical protein BTR23_09575 [Alkalihalophilus pseudofirmus]|nr:hypothetical protein BTR23_09575 [Alkalihalophilus pseudofirmus]
MKYKQIKRKRLYEEIAEEIQDMIKSGKLKPGDKIDPAHKLAEQFNVGRSAIREAFSALRAMGLVEMRHGEGAFVCEYDPNSLYYSIPAILNKTDVIQLMETRKILEIGSAYYAAERRTEKDLMKMEKVLNNMRAVNVNKELGEKADVEFHLLIADASKNKVTSSLMKNISQTMRDSIFELRRLWIFTKQTTVEGLYEVHLDIFKAIEQGDGKLAQQMVQKHFVAAEEVLHKYFDEINDHYNKNV